MSNPLCLSLLHNFENAITLVEETILQFDEEQWVKGQSFFQVPCKIAYHIADTLDYYFRQDRQGAYPWGHRFGGGWWQLKDAEQPTAEDMLLYLAEIRQRIQEHLGALADDDLARPFDPAHEHGETSLGHYVYALRHTMHHHGALSLLSLRYGNPEGRWL